MNSDVFHVVQEALEAKDARIHKLEEEVEKLRAVCNAPQLSREEREMLTDITILADGMSPQSVSAAERTWYENHTTWEALARVEDVLSLLQSRWETPKGYNLSGGILLEKEKWEARIKELEEALARAEADAVPEAAEASTAPETSPLSPDEREMLTNIVLLAEGRDPEKVGTYSRVIIEKEPIRKILSLVEKVLTSIRRNPDTEDDFSRHTLHGIVVAAVKNRDARIRELESRFPDTSLRGLLPQINSAYRASRCDWFPMTDEKFRETADPIKCLKVICETVCAINKALQDRGRQLETVGSLEDVVVRELESLDSITDAIEEWMNRD